MKLSALLLFVLSCYLPQADANTFNGLWEGPHEPRYTVPFPYAEHSSEIFQFTDTELLKTEIIGQQNSSDKFTYEVDGKSLVITDNRGLKSTYDYEFLAHNKLKLCSQFTCREFQRIYEMPALKEGSYSTPPVMVHWSWWLDGKLQERWEMPLQIFTGSYNSTDLSGLDFRWNHPSGDMFHLIFFNYLIFDQPEEIKSYGHAMIMAVTKQNTGNTPVIGGTLESPVFLQWNQEQLIQTTYKDELIEFRLSVSKN